MGSGTSLQHFCRQTQYHLPRLLFCQDFSRKNLRSKVGAWRLFLASYVFLQTSLLVQVLLCLIPPPRSQNCSSCKILVMLCVSYLPLFLPQNPAAVVSRTELGEIIKRSPLQCFCLPSCWTGQQSFLHCEKIPATLENRRPRPCNSQAYGSMPKTGTWQIHCFGWK